MKKYTIELTLAELQMIRNALEREAEHHPTTDKYENLATDFDNLVHEALNDNKGAKMKKELTVVTRQFVDNDGWYYLTDGETTYCWYTKSDKAFEELKVGTTHLCTFTIRDTYFNGRIGKTVTGIKNVRF